MLPGSFRHCTITLRLFLTSIYHIFTIITGTCRNFEERIAGLCRSDSNLRTAVAIHRQESHRRESGHVHQSRRCHPRDEKLHELRLESGQHLLRMRQQGYFLFAFSSFSHSCYDFSALSI